MALISGRNISLRSAIAAVVVAVWSIAVLDSLVTQDYTGLGIITPVAMIVVTFLFARTSKNGV